MSELKNRQSLGFADFLPFSLRGPKPNILWTAERTRNGLRTTISTEVETGIMAPLSKALTQQIAKRRWNLQKHRTQEIRSASEKYSWVIYWLTASSYSLATGAFVTSQELPMY